MSVKDVIKSSVYESFGGGTGISFSGIILILFMACLIGLYIFMIYKSVSRAAFYSKDLNVTIAGIVLIVAAIMVAMQSNLIVSLGMVGALSIVRFRNAVKNPMDLLFLFWAVSAGILCGVGLTLLAVATSATMTLFLLVLQMIPTSKASAVLVLRSENEEPDWDELKSIISKNCRYFKEKSRNIQKNRVEVIYELKCHNSEDMLKELKGINQLVQISYLTHDGELRV